MKLKLSDIRRKLSFKVQETCLVHTLSDFNRYKFELDFDVYLKSKNKNLQRPLCWTLEQKRELVLSALKGLHIPNLSIIQVNYETAGNREKRKTILQIIDGKQRLLMLLNIVYLW